MPWPWIVVALSLVDSYFAYRLNPRVRLFTKPAPWLAMLAWILSVGSPVPLPQILLISGILLSLVGDIMTMPQIAKIRTGFFFSGLGTAAYFVALNLELPPVNFSTFMLMAFVFLAFSRLMGRTWKGKKSAGMSGSQRLTIQGLLAVNGFFLLAGLLPLAKNAWMPVPAIAAATGALLIAISYILSAWILSVRTLPHFGLIKRVPLLSGHFLLIYAFLLHFN